VIMVEGEIGHEKRGDDDHEVHNGQIGRPDAADMPAAVGNGLKKNVEIEQDQGNSQDVKQKIKSHQPRRRGNGHAKRSESFNQKGVNNKAVQADFFDDLRGVQKQNEVADRAENVKK